MPTGKRSWGSDRGEGCGKADGGGDGSDGADGHVVGFGRCGGG